MNINLNLSVENDLTDVNHAINTVNAALKDKFKNQIKRGRKLLALSIKTVQVLLTRFIFK